MSTVNNRVVPRAVPGQSAQNQKIKKEEAAKKLIFDAGWNSTVARPNSVVKLTAKAKIETNDATVIVQILHSSNNKDWFGVESFKAEMTNGVVVAEWRATAVEGGNPKAERYSFKVFAPSGYGVSSNTLQITGDTLELHKDKFVTAAKPKGPALY